MKIICSFFLFFCITAFAEVEFLQLSDLDKYQFKLCDIYKEIDKHKVYSSSDYFCKIWGENEKRGNHFYKMYQLGIFDRIAPLAALVFNGEGLCIGYITKRCEKIKVGEYTQSNTTRIDFSIKHPPEFMEFLMQFVDIYNRTGYIFTDIKKTGNIGKLDGKYYLIDLDDAAHFEELQKKGCEINLERYEMISKNYHEMFGGAHD